MALAQPSHTKQRRTHTSVILRPSLPTAHGGRSWVSVGGSTGESGGDALTRRVPSMRVAIRHNTRQRTFPVDSRFTYFSGDDR